MVSEMLSGTEVWLICTNIWQAVQVGTLHDITVGKTRVRAVRVPLSYCS